MADTPPGLSTTSHVLGHLRNFWKFLCLNIIRPGALICCCTKGLQAKGLGEQTRNPGKEPERVRQARVRGGVGGLWGAVARARAGVGKNQRPQSLIFLKP